MAEITREQLHAYLDEALSDHETAQVEKALRDSEEMRRRLRVAREERDRGEHSLGAIWRRERLSCPTREQLNGHLHGILDADFEKYVQFHLTTVACATCLANLDDLKAKQAGAAQTRRRRKILDSSVGVLGKVGEGERK